MATTLHVRPIFFTVLGILSLITTLGGSAPLMPVQASQTTNDIVITMSEDHTTLLPGGQVRFTVRMTNLGPDDATFVDVGFNLPAQLETVSMDCDFGISPDGPFCEYSSLPAGATVVSRLVATTSSAAPLHSRLLKISAAVSFENTGVLDPHLGNNKASVTLRLVRGTHTP